MGIPEHVGSQPGQADALGGECPENGHQPGESPAVRRHIRAGDAGGAQPGGPGVEPQVRDLPGQPRPQPLPGLPLGAALGRPVGKRPPETLHQRPEAVGVHSQGRGHRCGPDPAGGSREALGPQQVRQAAPAPLRQTLERHGGHRPVGCPHPPGQLVPERVELGPAGAHHDGFWKGPHRKHHTGAATRLRPFHTNRLDTTGPSPPDPCR